jgi:hypothetical protein
LFPSGESCLLLFVPRAVRALKFASIKRIE